MQGVPYARQTCRVYLEFPDATVRNELLLERHGEPCRSEGCAGEAIHQSAFCRVHQHEMIKREPCPFLD